MDSLIEALIQVLKTANGPWPVLAIAIIGLYVLVWRFGGQILKLAREGNRTAVEAHQRVEHVADSIVTNHGSKNIGDAVDRLTEAVEAIHTRLDALEQRAA